MKANKRIVSLLAALLFGVSGFVFNASANADATYEIGGKTYQVDQVVHDFPAIASGHSNVFTDTDSLYVDFCSLSSGEDFEEVFDPDLYLLYDIEVAPGEGSPGAEIEITMFLDKHNYSFRLDGYLTTDGGEIRNGKTSGIVRIGDVVSDALSKNAYEDYLEGTTTFGDFHMFMSALYGGTVTFNTFQFVTLKEAATVPTTTQPSSAITTTTKAPTPTTTVFVDPQVRPATKDEVYAYNGKYYKVNGIIAEEEELGLAKQTIPDTVPPEKWFRATKEYVYRDNYWLAYDFTITGGNPASPPSVLFNVHFGDEGQHSFRMSDFLKNPAGLPAGRYKGLVKLADVLNGTGIENGVSPYYGVYVYEGSLYGGHIKIDRFALVTVEASTKGGGSDSPGTGVPTYAAGAGLLAVCALAMVLLNKKQPKHI